MRLLRFNEEGTVAFRNALTDLRSGGTASSIHDLLALSEPVDEVTGDLPDIAPIFSTKLEMTVWLREQFGAAGFRPDERDVGLWSWLAAYLFETICSVQNGKRKVLAEPHYILDILNHKRTYRHLVAAPWRLLEVAPEFPTLFLNEKPWIHGELMEQGMGRLYLMRIPAVAEAMERVYLNPETGRARRGIMPKTPKRGDFRNRFPIRIRQLMLTYDLMSMTTDELMERLGAEFAEGTVNDAG